MSFEARKQLEAFMIKMAQKFANKEITKEEIDAAKTLELKRTRAIAFSSSDDSGEHSTILKKPAKVMSEAGGSIRHPALARGTHAQVDVADISVPTTPVPQLKGTLLPPDSPMPQTQWESSNDEFI